MPDMCKGMNDWVTNGTIAQLYRLKTAQHVDAKISFLFIFTNTFFLW
jgi:hypothetical protein